MQALGRHLLVDLFDCDPEALDNIDLVKAAIIEAAKRAQATIVDTVFHTFNPCGISGVVVIAESHLAIHTWPEYRYAAADVFSCGDVLQPQVAVDYLVEQLGSKRASVVELRRGVFPGGPRPHKPPPTEEAPVAAQPRPTGPPPIAVAAAEEAPSRDEFSGLPDRLLFPAPMAPRS